MNTAKTHFNGNVYKKTFDNIGKDIMPIGIWSGPQPDMATDKYYSEFKELGINTFFSLPEYESHKDALIKHLELSEKYNMVGFALYSEKCLPLTREQMEEVHSVCSKYKSFAGIMHRDELPYGELWSKFVPVIREFKKTKYKDYDYYFNAFPYWADILGPEWLCGVSYSQYLKSHISKKGLGCFICYSDFYPFIGNNLRCRKNFFKQLAIQRDVAYKNKVPFGMYIQCGSICERSLGDKENTYNAFCWNINTTFAYGAKSISYFTMTYSNFGKGGWDDIYFSSGKNVALANKNADGTLSAIYNRFDNYKHNIWYDYAVRICKHIKAIDEVLLNSYNAGVICYGNSPFNVVKLGRIEGKKYYELIDIKGEIDLLIGCFEYKGKTALYVVNNKYEVDKEKQAELIFDNNYSYNIIQNGDLRKEEGISIKINLQSGEGVLIYLD